MTRAEFETFLSQMPYEKDLTRWPQNDTRAHWAGQYRNYAVQLAWEVLVEAMRREQEQATLVNPVHPRSDIVGHPEPAANCPYLLSDNPDMCQRPECVAYRREQEEATLTYTTLTILELVCQLIRAGWSVSYLPAREIHEWQRPDGISGSAYRSTELLTLPYAVLLDLATGAGKRTSEDDPTRCAVCGWPLARAPYEGCVRGNCSMRPQPERAYAPERARQEAYTFWPMKRQP